ncbi:flagellar protein FlaG [Marinobacter mobilis]|uniref:Flagellar protein FlaG n=1 Tax=Marinobacter mobilis TaxID=488533 RepID=A0A1H3DCI3_9GAMM|nr:flagellar protein FlaG [Marinobacter mobilis]SDX64086.1 flagellar protein FlaG [Marinobacter mobilis]
MNDVNLNSPDLKLVRSGEQASARPSTSPQAESRAVNADSVAVVPNAQIAQSTAGELSAASRAAQEREQSAQLDNAVTQLNDFVQSVQRNLQFEVDSEKGQTIVKVVDQQTQEVIRQMPDEVAVRLAEKLQQDEPLSLFTVKV